MKKYFYLVTVLTVLLFVLSCNSDSTDDNNDTFDKSAMQTNLADNIIIPAFQDLSTKLNNLNIAKNDFTASVNQVNLDNLRAAWLNAYKSWQYVEMFDIGKAEEILYVYQMNVYPTNSTDIESNLLSGSYDLTHANNNDAVGFPALDYLLYGLANTDADLLAFYATNANADKYKTYLSDLVNQMKSLTETVLNDWIGSYRDVFINGITNTASSTVNKFVNDYIFYYEKGLRANKVGIPSGVFSSTPLPTKIEALYIKNVSKELLLEALNAAQNLFNGKYYSSNTTGESFKTYLTYLDESALSTSINSKFDNARQKIQLLDNDFSLQINTDNTKMTQAYDALQEAVVLLKVEMLNNFNIVVDYVDADGD